MKSLQSLSYKTLLIIFFFSIAGIIFFLKIGGKTTKVSAAWWNESWNYRRSILISNPSNTNLSDFQVSVSIGTSAIIAQGRMKSDCSDIRITDASGNLLPHWIEENNPGCNSASGNTKIWVKANTISASGSTIYVYYGNASATSVENGNNVFDFFDDFSNGSIDTSKWNTTAVNTITSSIVSGKLRITDCTRSAADYWIYDNTDTGSQYQLNTSYIDNIAIDWDGTISNTSANQMGQVGMALVASNNTVRSFLDHLDGDGVSIASRRGWQYEATASNIGTSASETIPFSFKRSGSNLYFSANNTQVATGTLSSSPTKIALTCGGYGSGYAFLNYAEIDNLRIRKSVSSDPSTNLSSEEAYPGPIAYWKFDEGTGTTAFDSAGSNDGTISSATYTSESQCISGKCLNFDGSNDIIDTGSTFASLTSAFTISAWVNPGATQVAYADIFGNHGSSSGYNGIVCQQNNTTTNEYSCSYGNGSAFVKSSYFDLTANTWQYLSFVKNSAGTIVYVNGNPVASATSATSVTPSTYSFRIGQGYAAGGRYFKGKIDEFKIYLYARTAAQIKNDYNSRGSVNSSSVNLGIKSSTAPDLNSSLVAYYKFNENTGTSVYDSINNATGTVYNGATWMRTSLGVGLSLGGYGSNDYISLSNQPLNNTTSWSISTKLKYINLAKDFEFFLGQNDLTTGKILLRHSGYISFRGTNGTYYDFPTTSAEINNLDCNLLFVSNGTTIKLYINGIYKSSVTPASTSMSINIIGNAWTDTAWTSAFVINEVKIYNTALTDEQVKQDYNQGSAISFGQTTQNIGGTTTSLDYCIPGDTSYCATPVAEYNFEENTGTVANDTSGNNNNGTFGTGNSAPTWSTGQNNKGSGLSFDGVNDYVRAPLPTTQIDNWTISAWIKSNSASGIAGAVHVGGPGCTGYSISMSGGNWYPLFSCVNWNNTTAIAPVTVGQWTHITVVRDNGVLRAYANGVKTVTGVTTTPISPSGNYLNIGMVEAGNFFNGSIDQVKIYNYARTDAQVTYDYNRGKPIAQYKFDECQGTTVYNSISAGSTGVIVIGSSGTQNSLGICQIGTSAAWTNGANGKFNSSLNFDGTDDYVNLGNNTTITASTSQKSISVWIKVTGGESTWRAIISPSSSDFFHFQINNSNTLEVYFYGPAKSATSTTLFNSGNFNKWFHVTAVWDGTYAKLYINGNEENRSTAGSGSLTAATSNLYIGNGYNLSRPFNGQIDDVRIYNYALTNEQVKQIYNGGAINFQ